MSEVIRGFLPGMVVGSRRPAARIDTPRATPVRFPRGVSTPDTLPDGTMVQENAGAGADSQARGLETTASIIRRIHEGDEGARNLLAQRILPVLMRWAHGRVPARLRDMHDTDDLVQVTLIKALDRVKDFDPKQRGSFLAYLRKTMTNEIRDLIRRTAARPHREPIDGQIAAADHSPLEIAMGHEIHEAYEAALARLPGSKQDAVILRIEMGFTYPEVAAELDLASPDAARMLVTRALVRLADEMSHMKGAG